MKNLLKVTVLVLALVLGNIVNAKDIEVKVKKEQLVVYHFV